LLYLQEECGLAELIILKMASIQNNQLAQLVNEKAQNYERLSDESELCEDLIESLVTDEENLFFDVLIDEVSRENM
jgi:hypothetical protein